MVSTYRIKYTKRYTTKIEAELYQYPIPHTFHSLAITVDPAAESFAYPVSFDVRDLVTLEDVMEELQLGPNGGLLYCMEYLEENLDDWLGEQLQVRTSGTI